MPKPFTAPRHVTCPNCGQPADMENFSPASRYRLLRLFAWKPVHKPYSLHWLCPLCSFSLPRELSPTSRPARPASRPPTTS